MIVVSHRVPKPGTGLSERPFGGLEAVLAPLAGRRDVRWVSPALLRSTGLTAQVLDRAFGSMVSGRLWHAFHGLGWLDGDHAAVAQDWAAYELVNHQVARSVAGQAGAGELVLVNDLHFTLLPGLLSALRPDLRVAYLHYTPFPSESRWAEIPASVAQRLLRSMAAVPAVFLADRWRDRYEQVAGRVTGAQVQAWAAPVGPDLQVLREQARQEEVILTAERLRDQAGRRKLLVKVERVDPVKGGLALYRALDRLFEASPGLHEEVFLVAQMAPTRSGLPVYRRYQEDVTAAHRAFVARWTGNAGAPAVLNLGLDAVTSLACLLEYDVLVVNSIADGMNLVALEGPALNQRDGVLVLSSTTGAAQVLGDAPVLVDAESGDHEGLVRGLSDALAVTPAARAARAESLRSSVAETSRCAWILSVIDRLRGAGVAHRCVGQCSGTPTWWTTSSRTPISR